MTESDLIKARIYRSGKREFECKILETKEMVTAVAFGNLLKHKETIVVGDYVKLHKISEDKNAGYNIVEVQKRENEIFRILVREQKKKVTAANCDVLVIIISVSRPNFKRGILDRFLVRAYQWGIMPVVIFNKMDEYDPKDVDIRFERDRLKSLEINCYEVSAKNSDYKESYLDLGIEDLSKLLKNKTTIFLGKSGVGKSSLISALTKGQIDLKTKTVRKIGKGTHTTTWSEIIDCEDFTMIDSPGIRSFSLDDILKEELITLFPDVSDVAARCKFANCKHDESSKGCAFRDNLDTDNYETKLLLSRLEAYIRMFEEVSETPHWKKKT